MMGFNQEEVLSAIQRTVIIGDAINILNWNTNIPSGGNEPRRRNEKHNDVADDEQEEFISIWI